MKYLSDKPFSSAPANDAYRKGWEEIFGGNQEKKCSECVFSEFEKNIRRSSVYVCHNENECGCYKQNKMDNVKQGQPRINENNLKEVPQPVEEAKIKAFNLVREFFGDNDAKAKLWFQTPNPGLGMLSPDDLFALNRGNQVLYFIEVALLENKRE